MMAILDLCDGQQIKLSRLILAFGAGWLTHHVMSSLARVGDSSSSSVRTCTSVSSSHFLNCYDAFESSFASYIPSLFFFVKKKKKQWATI